MKWSKLAPIQQAPPSPTFAHCTCILIVPTVRGLKLLTFSQCCFCPTAQGSLNKHRLVLLCHWQIQRACRCVLSCPTAQLPATATSFMSQPSSHTVPQQPSSSTSTRPSQRWGQFIKCILGGNSANRRGQSTLRNALLGQLPVLREVV